jgi:hypothetical protein
MSLFPRQDDGTARDIRVYHRYHRRLWLYRTVLGNRNYYSSGSYFDTGRPWYDWHQVADRKGTSDFLITFPWVATHNHFALLGRGAVALQSAPVVELPEGATRWQHVSLLGLLNSSAACFWLKQNSNSKGSGVQQDGGSEPWQDFYEFTSSRVREIPLPADFNTWQAGTLEGLAQERAALTPEAVCNTDVPTAERFATARRRWESAGLEMIAVQEELDWEIYSRYGLLPENEVLTAPADSVPPLKQGERAFEIVLARRLSTGGADTTWFWRHGTVPVTEVPDDWPARYREIVARRIDAIERHGWVGVLERPEHKRRWAPEDWETMQAAALRGWLLDRCEVADTWFEELSGVRRPRPLTVRRLAETLCGDRQTVAAMELYDPGKSPVEVVAELVADEHVPFLAAMRHTPSGLIKRSGWEETWNRQRTEDAASTSQEKLATGKGIPLPPKYLPSDFRRSSFWSRRGKRDVPNERFISYPSVEPATPDELLIGWAGWDDRERAQVLADLVTEVVEDEESRGDHAVSLLAGLLEVLPWVSQWDHGGAREISSGLSYEEFLNRNMERVGAGPDVLRAWRPRPLKRGRPRKRP